MPSQTVRGLKGLLGLGSTGQGPWLQECVSGGVHTSVHPEFVDFVEFV